MTVKDIANLAVTGQALTLASASFPKQKSVKTKDILKMGVRNIVGVNLLKVTAQNVGSI